MDDMRKAGLNPILAYQQGPPGAPAGVAAQIPDFGPSVARGVEAGTKASRATEEKKLLKAQTATAAETAELTRQQQATEVQKRQTLNWTANRDAAAARELHQKGDLLSYQKDEAKLRQQYYRSKFGQPTVYVREGASAVSAGANSARDAVSSLYKGLRGSGVPYR